MSRVDFGAKPFVYPMPVLIIGTYDENGVPDAMNAAWGCITDMNEISISMSNHKTTENLKKTGAFTVSFATEDTVVACDYVGVESANKVPDKFARAGFHAIKSENVNAPLIEELPMALECKVKSFTDGILIGEIMNVNADESILTDGPSLFSSVGFCFGAVVFVILISIFKCLPCFKIMIFFIIALLNYYSSKK